MKIRKTSYTIFVTIFLFLAFSPVYSQKIFYPHWLAHQEYPPLEFSEHAESVLLIEFENQQVLYKKNEHTLRSIASLTKLMTAVLFVEAIQSGKLFLEQRYPLEEEKILSTLGPYDSRMGLQIGDAPSARELLQGMLIVSGNDAALFAASLVDPSIETFVIRMNQRARDLGLLRTSFADPTGLSERNVSVAHELALFASYILSYEGFDFTEYTSQAFFNWNYVRQNTNALLSSYPGTDALKTGYIEESGFNLIVSTVRNKRRILLVLLGISAPSIPIGIKRRKEEAMQFLDYAYENFIYVLLTQQEYQTKLWGAKDEMLDLESNKRHVSFPKNWLDHVLSDWKLDEEVLFAPVKKGTNLGYVFFYLQNEDARDYLLQLPLYARESVERANVFKVLWDKLLVSIRY